MPRIEGYCGHAILLRTGLHFRTNVSVAWDAFLRAYGMFLATSAAYQASAMSCAPAAFG
jgi:hypothetical protein